LHFGYFLFPGYDYAGRQAPVAVLPTGHAHTPYSPAKDDRQRPSRKAVSESETRVCEDCFAIPRPSCVYVILHWRTASIHIHFIKRLNLWTQAVIVRTKQI